MIIFFFPTTLYVIILLCSSCSFILKMQRRKWCNISNSAEGTYFYLREQKYFGSYCSFNGLPQIMLNMILNLDVPELIKFRNSHWEYMKFMAGKDIFKWLFLWEWAKPTNILSIFINHMFVTFSHSLWHMCYTFPSLPVNSGYDNLCICKDKAILAVNS